MKTEIEAKWLGINKSELRKKLESLGAKQVSPERLMRRRVFDFPDGRLYKIGGWVRVRDEGDKTTLSYKQLNDRTLHGTKEVSVVVKDFDSTCDFLVAIGLRAKSYQETKRESWTLNGCEVEIDEWPWIPPFVEIEAPNEKALKEVAELLDLNWQNALHGSVETAYQATYNVKDEEIDSWEEITFTPVPNWLEKPAKNRQISNNLLQYIL